MKKINNFLVLSFLFAGSMNIVKAEENRSDEYNTIQYDDQDDSWQDCYEAENEEAFKEFCDILLNTKIEDLKKLMTPGDEITFINFFTPNRALVDQFSPDMLNFMQSCTYLHILIMFLNSEELYYLEQNYSDNDLKESRYKIVELIKHALEIGVDVNATNIFNFTPLHIAILNSLSDFQIRNNNYALLEYYSKPLPDWKSVIFINSNVELIKILLAAGANIHIFFDSEGGSVDILEFLDEPQNEMDQCKKIRNQEVFTPEDIKCKMICLSLMPSFEGESADIYNILLQEFAAIKKLIQERI